MKKDFEIEESVEEAPYVNVHPLHFRLPPTLNYVKQNTVDFNKIKQENMQADWFSIFTKEHVFQLDYKETRYAYSVSQLSELANHKFQVMEFGDGYYVGVWINYNTCISSGQSGYYAPVLYHSTNKCMFDTREDAEGFLNELNQKFNNKETNNDSN